MTKNELSTYLLDMVENNKIVQAMIIDGVMTDDDLSPVYAFIRRLMGSLDNMDIIRPIHEKEHLISVKEISEQVVDNAMLKPYGSDYKIYLIDANLLREDSQNKLLKTLEEPQPYAIFILYAASAQRLLETVRSRCQILSLGDNDRMLASTDVTVKVLDILRRGVSEGAGNEMSLAKELVKIYSDKKSSYAAMLDIMQLTVADAIYNKETGKKRYSAEGEYEAEAACERASLEKLLYMMEAIKKAAMRISQNVNAENAITEMLMDFK